MVTDRTAREPDMHNDDDSRPRAVSVVANERPSRASEPPSLRSRESSPVPPDSTLSRSQPESERWLGSVNPRKAPSRVRPRGGDGGITPRMTAVFGGLFGLATMASIFAMLIQVFPVETDAPPTEAAIAGVEEGATPGEPQSGAAKRQRVLLPGPWRVDKLADTHKMIRGTMDRRSFIKALTEAGVPTSEVYRIIKSLEGVRKFDRTGRKDKFTVAMSRSAKKAIAFEYEVSPTEIYQARTGDDGLLSGAKLDMKVRTEEFAVSFYIGSDLQRSYKAAGLEDGVLDVINAAFNGQTSTEAFEEGGVVKIIVVEMTALGRFVRYDSLRAIEYRPPDPAKEPTRAYWFQGEAKGGYVDERGRQPSKQGWRMPVPGAPVTSQFNPRRMHPVLKRVMPHNGTDFGAPSGTPVYAAFRGTVELVGRYGASGNLVTVIHPGGVTTGYAHLSRFAKGTMPGHLICAKTALSAAERREGSGRSRRH